MYWALMRGFDSLPANLREDSNDLEIYRKSGEAVLRGQIPYRDFFIEYPPGSIPFFVPPALFADGRFEYINLFAQEMALVLISSLVLVALAARRLFGVNAWVLPAITFAAGAALLYPVAVTRYDAVVTLSLALAAFCAALGGRYVYAAYASLGLGAAAKLVPALAALPLALTKNKVVRGLAVSGVVGLLFFIPALVFGGERFIESFAYHAERGLQLESVWASVLIQLGLVDEVEMGFGAYQVEGSGVELMSSLSLPITAALLLFTCFVMYGEYRDGRLDAKSFPRYGAAFVLAFVIGSKVLSPQYMLWLLPLAPLVGGVIGTGVSVILIAACLLTTMVFPIHYEMLIDLRSPAPALLISRNLLLVAIWALLLARTDKKGKDQ
ncbi:MAG: glycosyltransferase 87 family protein [Rubrobacteraceae bacterium]